MSVVGGVRTKREALRSGHGAAILTTTLLDCWTCEAGGGRVGRGSIPRAGNPPSHGGGAPPARGSLAATPPTAAGRGEGGGVGGARVCDPRRRSRSVAVVRRLAERVGASAAPARRGGGGETRRGGGPVKSVVLWPSVVIHSTPPRRTKRLRGGAPLGGEKQPQTPACLADKGTGPWSGAVVGPQGRDCEARPGGGGPFAADWSLAPTTRVLRPPHARSQCRRPGSHPSRLALICGTARAGQRPARRKSPPTSHGAVNEREKSWEHTCGLQRDATCHCDKSDL